MPERNQTALNAPFVRGALVVLESQDIDAPRRTIPFQYNPEQLTRKLESRTVDSGRQGGGGVAREDVLRVGGPPIETITMTIVLDAADQLERPDDHPQVLEHGLNPALAILEMLLYPATLRVKENEQLADGGEVQVSDAELPLVLLQWGEMRVAPVQITSFSITEEAYDTRLNPVRAKVDLTLKVLTYIELEPNTEGRNAFITYQRNKETLAEQHPTSGGPAAP